MITRSTPIPPRQWYVQLATQSGLANRLRGWASIGAMADLLDRDFAVYWGRCQASPALFHGIFVPDTCAALTASQLIQRFKRKRVFRKKHATATPKRHRKDKQLSPDLADAFIKRRLERIRTLRLKPKLEDQLESFIEKVPADAIGVHVRRTDFNVAPEMNARLIAQMWREIEKDSDAVFLLCADNKNSINRLRDAFGERIFWRQQRMRPGRKRHTSVQDAAIDLYSLARTKKLLGTKRSSFSSYAAQLGGIELFCP